MNKIVASFLSVWTAFEGKKTFIGWATGHIALISDPFLRAKLIDLITNPSKENTMLVIGYGILSLGVVDRALRGLKDWFVAKGIKV